MRNIILLTCFLSLFSCRDTEQANSLVAEAQKLYFQSSTTENQIDSSLVLINKALQLDSKNISALDFKSVILFRLRDGEGSIDVAETLVKLLPGYPSYLDRLAFCNELNGNTATAKKLYSRALDMYVDKLEQYPDDFDLMLEYTSMLKNMNDTIQAEKIFERLRQINWNPAQQEILKHYADQKPNKQIFLDFWNRKISYKKLEELIQ